MKRFANPENIELPVALFLASDKYNGNLPGYSATGLIKPIRQTILTSRITATTNTPINLVDGLRSRVGSAIHAALEDAWLDSPEQALEALGLPAGIRSRILVNPAPQDVKPDSLPIYLEQRTSKDVDGVTVHGQYDIVFQGEVQDLKTTSVFQFSKQNKVEAFTLQGSIYRWLNPELITKDTLAIHYLLLDWSASRTRDPAYPKSPVITMRYPLMSPERTLIWIRQRLAALAAMKTAHDSELPECTDEELWRSEPVFKYYKNPTSKSRSTANFDTLAEAQARLAKDGHIGVIEEKKGEVRACRWCPAAGICQQRARLVAAGKLPE